MIARPAIAAMLLAVTGCTAGNDQVQSAARNDQAHRPARNDRADLVEENQARTVARSDQARPVRLSRRARQLRNRVKERFSTYFSNDEGEERFWAAALGPWDERLNACSTDACRRSEIRRQVDRMEFALGLSRKRIAGVPVRHGRFSITGGDVGGTISILPLDDDRMVVKAFTFGEPNVRWTCEVTAVGSWVGNRRTAILTAAGDAYSDEGGRNNPTMSLRVTSDRVVQLDGGHEAGARLCSVMGGVFGTYVAR